MSMLVHSEDRTAHILRSELRLWRLKGYQVRQRLLIGCLRILRWIISPALPKGVQVVRGPIQDAANYTCSHPGCCAIVRYQRSAIRFEQNKYTHKWTGHFTCPLCKWEMCVTKDAWEEAVKRDQTHTTDVKRDQAHTTDDTPQLAPDTEMSDNSPNLPGLPLGWTWEKDHVDPAEMMLVHHTYAANSGCHFWSVRGNLTRVLPGKCSEEEKQILRQALA
jgi:hypothetical protein